ncbi:UDP-glucose 4-epimerase GalE [Candidatus Proelusimicrobium excrementi]|uniref:UDP-glucose 4-epimerase GalE n=1 Tax=Candidatus Proelusimicrobium excrementi TaxID=3416222 RepID=UPI003CC14F91|nr:UDP-glucose 4-epimerase GalE [Elusimicrobiaceae bacterium]
MKNVLVVGGAGYIGSHAVKMLKEKGYNAVVYDNLSKGHRQAVRGMEFVKGDLGDKKKLAAVFKKYNIDAVMHFAAFIEVGESVKEPARYYNNNIVKVISLLDAMVENGVKYFVFSSTAATFGEPVEAKISERHPQNPINPYGQTKLMVEKVLKDYDKAYGLKSSVLRYFNAAGAEDGGKIGESHTPETHLLPIILQAASGKRDSIKIFGEDYPTKDGSCIRDFVHVNDLSSAHILALEKMFRTNESDDFNLGSGEGFSVKEVIECAKRVTGRPIKVEAAPRRAGDPAVLVADSAKAKKVLGWQTLYNLDKIIQTAWNWELKRKY